MRTIVFAHFAGALLASLSATAASAQRAPIVGVVLGAGDHHPGSLVLSAEADPDGGYVYYEQDAGCYILPDGECGFALVNVDGRNVRVNEYGAARTERATDEIGVSRTYNVVRLRDRRRTVEVELWTRSDGCEVHTCTMRGGMTVRRAGRSATVRVVGYAE